MWNPEPTMWDRIVMVGFGTWFLCLCALVAGAAIARLILIPGDADAPASRARQLAQYRTLIGFGFVTSLSYPYRSLDSTLDKVWGNFNVSIVVALSVFVVFSIVFWLGLKGDPWDRMRAQWPAVWGRAGGFVATIAMLWGVMWLCEQASDPEWARLELIVLGGFFGLFAMGCWCISCHWFGIGLVHPLLPPIIAAMTISVMTVLELHFGGPELLPIRLWLLINFAAVITTFGVCLVEICDALAESRLPDGYRRGVPEPWPVMVAGTIAAILLTGVITLIMTGTAEQILCADELVRCASPIR